jgi:hypothetical protein
MVAIWCYFVVSAKLASRVTVATAVVGWVEPVPEQVEGLCETQRKL